MLTVIRNLTSFTRRGGTVGLLRNTLFTDSINCSSSYQIRSNIGTCHRLHSDTGHRKSNDSTKECMLHKRYITVRTCYDLWIDVPKGGLTFDVEYYDSCPDEPIDPKVPLVVALHDCPGSAEDLLPVLNLLAKLGYRVLAPNFPGYGETKWLKWREWNVFTGALDEKMHFVFDFQMTLNIRRVDVVLGYGLGCSTSVALVGTDSTVFRSAALLCPAEHTPLKPVKGKLQFQNAVRLTNLWESLQARPFVWLYMILMRGSYGYSGYTTMQVINTARTIAGSRYKTLQTFMLRIQMKDTPCRVVYHSVDDSKIPSNISKMYAELLGITSDDFIVYNEDNKISNQGNANFSKGLRIEAETPVLLETYSKPIAGMVRDLINTLKIPK